MAEFQSSGRGRNRPGPENVKFENGELSGLLLEPAACEPAQKKYMEFSEEEMLEIHRNFQDVLADYGIAAASEMFADDYTEETMKKYPFAFVLKIGYNLTGNELKVMWKVENPDTKTLYFSIGAHPAFLCPFHDEESKLGYGLQFAGLKELHHHGNTPDTGLAVMSEDIVIPLEDEKVYFTPGFFDRCTYMVEGKQTGEVSLVTPDGKPYVTMDFDAPLFAIWSPEGKDAPFVCIEPWYGRCDADDFDGTLEERAYENAVEPEQIFEASYSIRYL